MLSLPQAALAAGQPDSATPLARGVGYASAVGSPQVKALQRRLQTLGEEPGPVDGLFGPITEGAVRRLQARSGLAADGLVGPATRTALRRAQPRPVRVGAGLGVPGGSAQVRALQSRLHTAGQPVGPIDGVYGPKTEAAVRHLQARRGLAVDGVAGPRTYAALGQSTTGTPPVSVNGNQKTNKAKPGNAGTSGNPRAEAPATRPVAHTDSGGKDDSGGVPWWLIAIGVALIGALIAFVATRGLLRRRPDRSVVPLGRGLELEGTSSDPSIGSFRGTAYAVDMPAISDPRRRAEASRFFVLDPRRKLPFWVDYSDVDTPLPPALQAHPGPIAGGPELSPGTKVLGYVTVPKAVPERQAKLYEQLAQIEGLCKRRRFELVGVVRDVEPNGDDVLERPGVRYAFEQFRAGRAGALVVSDVRRLSVSRAQLDSLLARLTAENVALVALEPELDTSTEEGREVLRQLEIVRAERTKLAEAAPSKERSPIAERPRARSGRITGGAGPEAVAVKERVLDMRDNGESLQSIAEALTEEGGPPPRGGPRRASSVRASLSEEEAEDPGNVVRLNPAASEPGETGEEPGPNQHAGGGSRRR